MQLVPNLLDHTLEILRSQRRLDTSICFNVSRPCKELFKDGCENIHRFDPGAGHLELRTHVRDPVLLTKSSLLLDGVVNNGNNGADHRFLDIEALRAVIYSALAVRYLSPIKTTWDATVERSCGELPSCKSGPAKMLSATIRILHSSHSSYQ